MGRKLVAFLLRHLLDCGFIFIISFSLARGSGFGFECVRKVRPRAFLTDVVSKIRTVPRFVETQHTTRDTADSRLQRCRN
jgi:hypothetical protein